MNQTQNQPTTIKFKGLSTFWLKIIAIITMTIDHTAVCLETPYYTLMRGIGRIAFPIFCYLIVEGFFYTRCLWKYILRLFVFALISQIPFNLMLYKSPCYTGGYLNVYFTLLIGLITIYLVNKLITQCRDNPNKIYAFSITIIILCTMCIGELLHTDYGAFGILLICLFYFFRNKPVPLCLSVACSILLLSSPFELYALPALPFILMHNHRKGPGLKYFFYVYYPAHMLVLYLILYFV